MTKILNQSLSFFSEKKCRRMYSWVFLVKSIFTRDQKEMKSTMPSSPLKLDFRFVGVLFYKSNLEVGLQVVAVASLPKEIAAGLHPKQSNAIRGLLLQSGWVVEKLEDDSCVVTYVVQVIEILLPGKQGSRHSILI